VLDGSFHEESQLRLHASIGLFEVFLATNGNEVAVRVLVEELEVLRKSLAESFDSLLEQGVIVVRLSKLFSLVR